MPWRFAKPGNRPSRATQFCERPSSPRAWPSRSRSSSGGQLLPWAEEDWSAHDEAEKEARFEALLRSDRERGFDVAVAPLNRVTLVRLADEEHRLVWSTHHLYVDGWSWPLVFRDVGAAYAARLRGSGAPPAPRTVLSTARTSTGSAARRRTRASSGRMTSPASQRPHRSRTRQRRSRMPRWPASRRPCGWTPKTTARLQGLARDLRVTLNVLIQGAWAVLLGHLSGRDEVVFGAAFSGRPAELPGVEGLVGPCVNNLPVRVRLDAGRGVPDWLQELHERNQEIAQHQFASLSDIQDWAGVPWRLRLFDSLVVFQNYQVNDKELSWGEVDVELLAAPETTNYPLTLNVTPREEIELKVIGQAHLFRSASVTMILDGFASVLRGLAEHSGSSLSELQSLLPASTKGIAAHASAAAPPRRQAEYVAPGDDVERAVAEVWEELFQIDQVGVDDNFFDLGGHSILLLQAHTRLRERFGNDLSIVDLLQYPTVRSLARYLENGVRSSASLDAVRARASRQRQALAKQRDRLRERR